jgi:glycosyltransferase involved in cell wall biosynthesis
MRILHVNDYPLDDGGGAEVMVARTMALLRARGADVNLFTADDLPDRRRTTRRYFDNAIARRALAARLRLWRPDIIHLHNYYHLLSPGILAELDDHRRQMPLRIVMTAHDYHLVCPNAGGNWYARGTGALQPIDPGRLGSAAYLLTRRWDHRSRAHALLKLAQHWYSYRWHDRRRVMDVVLCPSRFLEALVRPVVRAARLLPHPAPPPRDRGKRPPKLRLVFVGRLEPEKGLGEFLEALPADFPGTLTVVGDGSALTTCRQTCARRDLTGRVEFLGRLPHPQALAEIARSHVLVMPSRCLESYGLTLIEALAAGTNVLAADRGAMRELVEDAGVGYLFAPGDANGLALQLDDIRRAHRAGALNRFDVSAFLAGRSEAAYVDALWRIYQGDEAPRARAA